MKPAAIILPAANADDHELIALWHALTAPNRYDRGTFVVEVWNGKRWAKVRGDEGGPWDYRGRAERIARAREAAERRTSSTEGMPHRVRQLDSLIRPRSNGI